MGSQSIRQKALEHAGTGHCTCDEKSKPQTAPYYRPSAGHEKPVEGSDFGVTSYRKLQQETAANRWADQLSRQYVAPIHRNQFDIIPAYENIENIESRNVSTQDTTNKRNSTSQANRQTTGLCDGTTTNVCYENQSFDNRNISTSVNQTRGNRRSSLPSRGGQQAVDRKTSTPGVTQAWNRQKKQVVPADGQAGPSWFGEKVQKYGLLSEMLPVFDRRNSELPQDKVSYNQFVKIPQTSSTFTQKRRVEEKVKYLDKKYGQKFDEPPRNERVVDRIALCLHGGVERITETTTQKSKTGTQSKKTFSTGVNPYSDLLNQSLYNQRQKNTSSVDRPSVFSQKSKRSSHETEMVTLPQQTYRSYDTTNYNDTKRSSSEQVKKYDLVREAQKIARKEKEKVYEHRRNTFVPRKCVMQDPKKLRMMEELEKEKGISSPTLTPQSDNAKRATQMEWKTNRLNKGFLDMKILELVAQKECELKKRVRDDEVADKDYGLIKANYSQQLGNHISELIELKAVNKASDKEIYATQKKLEQLTIVRCKEYLQREILGLRKKIKSMGVARRISKIPGMELRDAVATQPPEALVLIQDHNAKAGERDNKRAQHAEKQVQRIKLMAEATKKETDPAKLMSQALQGAKKIREARMQMVDASDSDSDLSVASKVEREKLRASAVSMREQVVEYRRLMQLAKIKNAAGNIHTGLFAALAQAIPAHEIYDQEYEEGLSGAEQWYRHAHRSIKTKAKTLNVDKYAQKEYEKEKNRVHKQIGDLVFYQAMDCKKQRANHDKMKLKVKSILAPLLKGILSPKTAQRMQQSVWKNIKYRHKVDPDNASDTSFDSAYLSDVHCEGVMEEKGHGVIKKRKFDLIYKKGIHKGTEVSFGSDMDFIYQEMLQSQGETMLPLPTKILNGVLALEDYTLSIGQCRALAKMFELAKPHYISTLILSNCGIDDAELAAMLKGLENQKGFSVFQYKYNEFMNQSLQNIIPILTKPAPNHLRELNLQSCKSTPQIIEKLLDVITEDAIYLQSLNLSSMNLSKSAVVKIARFLRSAVTMLKLDISKNNLLPDAFSELLEEISTNKTLMHLSFSDNLLVAQKAQAERGNVAHLMLARSSSFHAVREYVEGYYMELRKRMRNAREAGVEGQNDRLIRCLGNFIRRNKNLQYLDLDSTGLSHRVIVDLVPQLQRAKALLSVHFGHNPGIDDQLYRLIMQRLRVKPPPKSALHLTFEKGQVSAQAEELYFREGIELQGVSKDKNLNKVKRAEVISLYPPLAITRILGHKQEAPGLGQWKLLGHGTAESCWIRDLTQYTLVLWSPEIGEYHERNTIQIDNVQKQEAMQKITSFNNTQGTLLNPVTSCEIHDTTIPLPMIACEANRWVMQPMYRLIDFMKLFQEDDIDFTLMAERQERSTRRIQRIIESKEEEGKKEDKTYPPDFLVLLRQKLKQELILDLREKSQLQRVANFNNFISTYGRYEKPNYINLNIVGKPLNTYVIPLFMKPGRQNLFVFAPGNERVYYSRHVTGVRKQQIPPFAKELKSSQKPRQFMFSLSVFKSWECDTEKVVKDALAHDKKHWKVDRVTKDDKVSAEILQMIDEHWAKLNETWITSAAISSFPVMTKPQFGCFCQEAGLYDQSVQADDVDRMFPAANVELEDQEGNDDRALCRFEFFELLIRLAKLKFFDTGKASTLPRSFERLLNEHIFNLYGSTQRESWHRFRADQLWTVKVNDVFDVNHSLLEKIYQTVCRKEGKQVMSRMASIKLFTTETEVNLTPKRADICFALSKMTVANEGQHGATEYSQLRFVEFLEMIARVGCAKFKDTPMGDQWGLEAKIFYIIDALAKADGLKAIPVGEDEGTESESDKEY